MKNNNNCLISFECFIYHKEGCYYREPRSDGTGCKYCDTFVGMREPNGCENLTARKDAMQRILLKMRTEEEK